MSIACPSPPKETRLRTRTISRQNYRPNTRSQSLESGHMERVPKIIRQRLVVGASICEDVDIRGLPAANALEAYSLDVTVNRQRRRTHAQTLPVVREHQRIRAHGVHCERFTVCGCAEGARAGCARDVVGSRRVSHDCTVLMNRQTGVAERLR